VASTMAAVEGKMPFAGYTLTIRAAYPDHIGTLDKTTSTITEARGDMVAPSVLQPNHGIIVGDTALMARPAGSAIQLARSAI
jgi:hypothetical protein